jgi:hypothetical protein
MNKTYATYHAPETPDIQSLEHGTMVQLDGEIGMFLSKDSDPNGRIAIYSFLMSSGKVRGFKETSLVFKNLRRIG